MRNIFKDAIDAMFGKPIDTGPIILPRQNRAQKRRSSAIQCRIASAPKRRKHEKRGAPGRSSKGRKPHRRR